MSNENQNAENTSANAQDTSNTGDNTSLLAGDDNSTNTEGTQNTDGTNDDQNQQAGNASDKPIEYDIKLPDGFEVPEGSIEELTTLLNKSKVAKEEAQGIVDFYFKVREHEGKKTEKIIADYKASLIAQTKADAEIGGMKLQENLTATKKAIVKFGGKELLDRLIETGLDCDPTILKAWFRVSKSVSEGAFYEGGVPKVDGIKRTVTGEPILNFEEKK